MAYFVAMNIVLFLAPRGRGNVDAEMVFPNKDTKRRGSVAEKHSQEPLFSLLETEFAEPFQPKRDICKSLRVFRLFKSVIT